MFFRNILLLLTVSVALTSYSEVKPAGTILPTFCGANKAPSQERNRFIKTVCFAGVVGQPGISLVAIQAEDSRGRKYPLEVYPIVARKNIPIRIAGFKQDELRLGTNETQKLEKYTTYVSLAAVLISQVTPGSGPIYFPKSLSGRDKKGVAYEVPKLEVIFHTL